ncbi:MAG: exodeoxyribonuclease VII large subunit [Clostridia bacterium]|nr:exodeoxyribonuclease VII large subunit [Clostridia bacterium]
MEEIIISVSQLNTYITRIFQAEELLYNISVKGEISGLKTPSKDMAFFDLKDENSLIHCVCFDENVFKFFKNGDSVVARGTPKFYSKGGRLDFNVNKITMFGQGELYLKFLQLKEQLNKEGLFDNKIKKNLPENVKRIGVITSETGAVVEDIINISKRRNPSVDIIIYPAKVQGIGAELEIVRGIEFFSDYNIDVIIIARGGGSFEDLNVFNSEIIARSAFKCPKPLVSAIGHETDFTILDFVADVRAPTPSAGAELVISDIKEKKSIFKHQCSRLNDLINSHFAKAKNQFQYKQNFFLNNMKNLTNEYKYYLSLKKAMLEKLNPNNILKSGYAKVSKYDIINNKECTITSVNQLVVGDIVDINFYDGKVKGEIK